MEIRFSYSVLASLFDGALPSVKELEHLLTLHSFEVTSVLEDKNDSYITIDILPNRAHDCLGYYFLAKEISVLTGITLKPLPFEKKESSAGVEVTFPSVTVSTPLCRRYISRRINSVSVGESPAWLRDALLTMGQKSINNIVDATNYVMWITNQPLHAFDAAKVVDSAITIRFAKKGESILTLDGKRIELDTTTLTIADPDGPLAIAGVKGGVRAEITRETSDIILESANFDSVSVRKASQKIGIRTESSKRFEHEISPELAALGMDFVTDLILKVGGSGETRISDVVDVYANKDESRSIILSPERVNRILGTEFSDKDITEILDRLDFKVDREGESYQVQIPSERIDIQIEADLIEEVGRVWGYDKIKGTPLSLWGMEPNLGKNYFYRAKIEDILVNSGFSQIEMYSLVPKGDIEIENPLAEDKNFLRNNLKDGVLLALRHNAQYGDLLGVPRVKVFEIGTIFKKSAERVSFALGIRNTKLYRGKEKESVELKNILNFLAEKLGIPEEKLASYTEVLESEEGVIAEIGFEELIASLPNPSSYKDVLRVESPTHRFVSLSPFPFISRDIALFVPEGTEKELIEKSIVEEGGFLLVRQTLFDVFEKEGKMSYAYRLAFQATDRTLTDTEINNIMKRVTARLEGNPGWQVR